MVSMYRTSWAPSDPPVEQWLHNMPDPNELLCLVATTWVADIEFSTGDKQRPNILRFVKVRSE
jgi:hypothetical protein